MKATSPWSLVIAAAVAVTLATAQEARSQTVIIFDDFLTDNFGMPGENLNGPLNPNGFLLWTVTDGSVDLVGPSQLENPDITARYVDLGGSTGDPGLFSYAQPVTLLPGVSYTFSFIYNSVDGNFNRAAVNLAGFLFEISSSTTEFQTFSANFTLADPFVFLGPILDDVSNSPLSFQNLGGGPGDNAGIGIDRIVLAPTLIPEPSSAMLAVATLGLLAFKRRRA